MSDNKFKIVLTRSLLAADLEYIKLGLQKLVGDSFIFIEPERYDEDAICDVCEDADVLLGPYVSKKILEKAKQLKLIQVPWTGMDSFDFSSMQGSQIPVCNTHSNADAVAEIGLTLILDLLKKVSYHDRKMRVGDWNRSQEPLNLKSKMLSKQKVCILGCGNIGYRIAKLIKVFGAEIIAVDDKAKSDEVVDEVYANKEIASAIEHADVVVCTLPLTKDTANLMDAKFVETVKTGALIVNVSRAGIVDEDALYEGLCSGKIGGYAADVWWNAPKRGESQSYPSEKNEFWKLENVILSPHRAGFVEDSLPHLDEAIVNLANLIQGKELINRVNVEACY